MVSKSLSVAAVIAAVLTGLTAGAGTQVPFPGPWEKYNNSPANRTLTPVSVHSSSGNVSVSGSWNSNGAVLSGPSAIITLDFGQETAGLISLAYGTNVIASGDKSYQDDGLLGLAFSESEQFIGVESDNSTSFDDNDGRFPLVTSNQSYTLPPERVRGGFRFLTISISPNASATTSIQVSSVSLQYSGAPAVPDDQLQAYSGYFYCDEDLINRIWYAGAYTIQLCEIGAHQARAFAGIPDASTGLWFNNATVLPLSASDQVLVDGAKRDRSVWSGDYSLSSMVEFVSSVGNDRMLTMRNGLDSIIYQQNSNGLLPYVGPPMTSDGYSDTYHLHGIIDIFNYYQYSNDVSWLTQNWPSYLKAMDYSLQQITSNNLYNCTNTLDWGRVGQGGENIEVNALFYRSLVTGAQLAMAVGSNNTDVSKNWTAIAANVKAAVNNLLWDTSAGLFKDNTSPGTTVHPQDGNSMAVVFDLANDTYKASISEKLQENWNQYGAVGEEGNGVISPFIGGFEIEAHLLANPGNASAGMELLRRQWGYMLQTWSNASTVEGYDKDGSLHYAFYPGNADAYISFAHGWSTGPTAWLTFTVAGLEPTSPLGKTWQFVPHAIGSGLSMAQTGFQDTLGTFQAGWEIASNGSFSSWVSSPSSTTGVIGIPKAAGSGTASVYLDNTVVLQSNTTASGYNVTQDDNYWYIQDVKGGKNHTISIKA
ncbi:hypothetical protein NQZ79_g2565 [Umbelopsis isabellina]|nr:hypothetical protein NQZ79_g2565 [Umbelopsis isabellina]